MSRFLYATAGAAFVLATSLTMITGEPPVKARPAIPKATGCSREEIVEYQRPRRPAAGQQADLPRNNPAEQPKYRPYDPVRLAALDEATIPLHVDRKYIRYLTTYNERPSRYIDCYKILAFVTNSLSKASTFRFPYVVPGSEGMLLRINLYDLQIDPAEFDRLCDLGSGSTLLPEPYFQEPVISLDEITNPGQEKQKPKEETQTDAGKWKGEWIHKEDPPGVKWYDANHQPIWVEKWTWIPAVTPPPTVAGPAVTPHKSNTPAKNATAAKRKFVPEASWLTFADGGVAIRTLVDKLYTNHPIVRGDWFATYALWAPRYYDLLGTGKTLAEFQKLARIRAKEDADVALAGVVVKPPRRLGVTNNDRFIEYFASASQHGAYYWQTNDTAKSTNDRQYLNTLLDILKQRRGLPITPGLAAKFFDATEDIFSLRNGLQAYFLSDGEGNRVDKAVADIAGDRVSAYRDFQVWCARNCITCHTRGIKPIDEAIRVRMPGGKPTGVIVVDDDKKKTNSTIFEDAVGKPLAPIIAANQAFYDAAILAVTQGWNAEKLTREYMEWTADYLDDGITIEKMAWDVGIPVVELRQLLARGIGLDPTLSDLLQDPPLDVRRDQYENNGYPQLQRFLEVYYKRKR